MPKHILSLASPKALDDVLLKAGRNDDGVSPYVRVARALNRTPAFVYSWRTTRRIPEEYWPRLAQLAGITLDELATLHSK